MHCIEIWGRQDLSFGKKLETVMYRTYPSAVSSRAIPPFLWLPYRTMAIRERDAIKVVLEVAGRCLRIQWIKFNMGKVCSLHSGHATDHYLNESARLAGRSPFNTTAFAIETLLSWYCNDCVHNTV